MEHTTIGPVTVVKFEPRLDATTVQAVDAYLQEILRGGATQLVGDLSATQYISSAGLRLLLSTMKQVQKAGGRFVCSGLVPYVREIFETAGFLLLFSVYETEAEARESFGR